MNIYARILLLFSVLFLMLSCTPKDRYISISGYAQGGTYTVKLNLNGKNGIVTPRPEEIRDSVDAILKNIDGSISGYNKNSLLSRFNEGETIAPDDIFMDIYVEAYEIYEETGGVVDVAAAPLFDIWGFGFKSGSMPSEELVAKTVKECGMGRLKKDIVLTEDGLLNAKDMLKEDGALPKLNYNAIAQGYSCDLVAKYLYSIGIKDMMVDIGEIFCDGRNPSGESWALGIDKPVDGVNELGVELQGVYRVKEGACGVVTSGNYRKFYIREGKKYSHTIDPKSGYPVQHQLLSATVAAPDAMLADAYATYCMVVGLEAAKEFIASRSDLEACLIYDSNGSYQTWCSEGFVLESI